MDLNFKVEARCGETQARLGRFRTTHNEVETPQFMPVGTMASVKGVDPDTLVGLGATVEDVAELGVTAVVVTVGLSDVPAPVNFTTAYTRNARTAAVRTPSPTSATGRWSHGVGGGVGSVIGYRP